MNPRRRRRRVLVMVLVLLGLVLLCGRPPPTTLGTFNIRTFPADSTDLDAVALAIADLDADAFAVQEIVDRGAFDEALARANDLSGRRYKATLVPAHCLGNPRELHLGVVYDAKRLQLTAHQFLGDEPCTHGQPSGMAARLESEHGDAFVLTSVHFAAGDSPRQRERRVVQWRWLVDALPGIRVALGGPVIVAGDFNSTGYLHPGDPERAFIDVLIDEHGLQLPTASLECSMYWKNRKGRYDISLLDHLIAPSSVRVRDTEVLGMCQALHCERQVTTPPGFDSISDHCPVRVRIDGLL